MKKITKKNKTQFNQRGFTTRCASAIVCFALLLLGASAFAAPVNDNFANAEVVSGTSFNVDGTTFEGTRENGEPTKVAYPADGALGRLSDVGNRSVWYRWTAPASGTYTLRTQATPTGPIPGTDTQLGVYTGSLGSLTEVASAEDYYEPGNDNVLGLGQSQLSFTATSGTDYMFMVNGWDSLEVNFKLILTDSGVTPPPPTGLTLTVNTTGSGNVTRDVAQPVDGYATNAVVTLTAVPTGTNTFVSWGGAAADQGSTNPITITMDDNKVVTATFTTNAGGGTNTPGNNVLTVAIVGTGKVSPNLNGKSLVIGKNYKMTARPGKDHLFSSWSGVLSNASNPKLVFAMQEGMVITANFAPNPFANTNNPVTGTYTGLLFDTNAITQGCSGNFTLKVRKTGKFTLRVNKGRKAISGSGQFDETGAATATIGRGTNALNVHLQLDMLGGSDTVTGTVVGTDCNATLEGDRAVFHTSKNPAALAGNYTLLLPRSTNSVNANGFATLAITKAGKVTIRGELGDGTKFSQSTTLSKDGQIPVYVLLYKKEGSLIGWLTATATNITGTMSWIKPGVNGFEVDIPATGSPYNSAAAPLIALTNGVAEIGAGGLATPLHSAVSLDGSTFVVGGANENDLKLKVAKNGTVSGSFINPNTGKKTALRGIVLQNANSVGGRFSAPEGSGYLDLADPVVIVIPETTVE